MPDIYKTLVTDDFSSRIYDRAVDELTARYPFIGRGIWGRSVAGAPLWSLSMGEGGAQVFMNAAHHANEWITTPVLFRFIEEYAESVASGRPIYGLDVGRLYRTTVLYAVPLVNPDGAELVNGTFSESNPLYGGAVRNGSRYPDIPFPSGWKANITGTDLNLNYPAGWETAKEIKFEQGFTTPAPRDYVGEEPLSAPESEAMYVLTRNLRFRITISLHTQGEVIYWKYLDYEPEGSYEIAQLFSRNTGYAVETTPYSSGFAGYKDWFIQDHNRPGYTVEIGLGENPLPITDFDEIYERCFPIFPLSLYVAPNVAPPDL